jgi:ADP-ribosylglycohydrolase
MDKFKACIILHALGDTIGFKNGDWEFNYNYENISVGFSDVLLFEFIGLGGIIGINLKGWRVSDDTVLHMATIKALLGKFDTIDNYMDILTEKYIKAIDDMKKRFPGKGTLKSLERIDEGGMKWDEIPFEYVTSGIGSGSGASMRTLCIGLVFSKNEDIDKLIEYSIESSRITHNGVIGYLGGMTSALFTAFAIEKIETRLWPYKLIELFESNKIDNYIKNRGREFDEYLSEKNIYINYWRKYIELKFDNNKQHIRNDSDEIPHQRSQFFLDYFSRNPNPELIGGMGHDSVIFAYDALISSAGKWETLVVYSMLHCGDSDTTGSIAGGWYGAIYGLDNIPLNNTKYLEYKDKLNILSEKLYNKYHK